MLPYTEPIACCVGMSFMEVILWRTDRRRSLSGSLEA
jgi:hypothetical protein